MESIFTEDENSLNSPNESCLIMDDSLKNIVSQFVDVFDYDLFYDANFFVLEVKE